MKLLRSARWLFLGMILCLVPASSFAGVFISVGFAPPVLPVYEQPPCPEPGWMWTPGYWAYGDEGYYWVPGTWVPAPYEGALWTPPYWGWSNGLYVFHTGYWGPHVGYYGGVNYGFGYMGIGFIGGRWHGHDFEYNRAYMHVDERRIHNVYEDRRDEERYTVARDSRVAYSGGPGGIRHDAAPEERIAMHDQHVGRTSFQTQHVSAAQSDHNSYFNNNHGRPSNVAVSRPMAPVSHGGTPNNIHEGQQGWFNNNRGAGTPSYRPESRPMPPNGQAPQYQGHGNNGSQPHPAPQYQGHGNNGSQPHPAPQYQPRNTPNNQSRPAPAPKEQHQQPHSDKDHRN